MSGGGRGWKGRVEERGGWRRKTLQEGVGRKVDRGGRRRREAEKGEGRRRREEVHLVVELEHCEPHQRAHAVGVEGEGALEGEARLVRVSQLQETVTHAQAHLGGEGGWRRRGRVGGKEEEEEEEEEEGARRRRRTEAGHPGLVRRAFL